MEKKRPYFFLVKDDGKLEEPWTLNINLSPDSDNETWSVYRFTKKPAQSTVEKIIRICRRGFQLGVRKRRLDVEIVSTLHPVQEMRKK